MTKFTKGKIVEATVTGIEPYGIFVSLDEYYSGLIHISEISHNFVKDVHYYVKIGDVIEISFGTRTVKIRVLAISEHMNKDEAHTMYEEVR